MEQRFSLDKSSKKFTCPSCGKHKRFTRYKDNELNQYLSDEIGICDRKDSCQHHIPPRVFLKNNPDYFKKNDSWRESDAHKTIYQAPTPQPQKIDYLPENISVYVQKIVIGV